MREPLQQVRIVAFRAADQALLTEAYDRGRQHALDAAGVAVVRNLDDAWRSDRESTVITVLHGTWGVIGGIRLQLGRAGAPLPMQEAIAAGDPELQGFFRSLVHNGAAELCGLWVDPRFIGAGLPPLLVRAGVAVAHRLPITSLLTFAAQHTLPRATEVGFLPMGGIGDGGALPYPLPHMRSYAMRIADPLVLEHARTDERARILSLRLRPIQQSEVHTKRAQLEVQFELDRDAARDRRPLDAVHDQARSLQAMAEERRG